MSNWGSDLSEVVCGTKGTVRLRLRYSRPASALILLFMPGWGVWGKTPSPFYRWRR